MAYYIPIPGMPGPQGQVPMPVQQFMPPPMPPPMVQQPIYQQNDMAAEIERIARVAIKVLCKIGSPLFIRDLARHIGEYPITNNWEAPMPRLGERQLYDIISKYPNNFVFTKKSTIDEDIVVAAKTSLGLCKDHCSRFAQCPGIPLCQGLHICRYYLLSNSCKFSRVHGPTSIPCQFGHDMTTTHNRQLLQQNIIDHLTVPELRFLFGTLKSRSQSTLPNICRFYNVESGCRSASQGKECPFIHICRHYVMDQCRFGVNCKRNHNINDQQVRGKT